MPDRAAGEAVNHIDAKGFGRARRVDHLLRATLAHAIVIAVAPETIGQNGAMPLVDEGFGDALADQVVADGEVLQPVLLQYVMARANIGVAR